MKMPIVQGKKLSCKADEALHVPAGGISSTDGGRYGSLGRGMASVVRKITRSATNGAFY